MRSNHTESNIYVIASHVLKFKESSIDLIRNILLEMRLEVFRRENMIWKSFLHFQIAENF